jgi:hypothetical protein
MIYDHALASCGDDSGNQMTEIFRSEKRSETLGRNLAAPLREFLDAVIIPALIERVFPFPKMERAGKFFPIDREYPSGIICHVLPRKLL